MNHSSVTFTFVHSIETLIEIDQNQFFLCFFFRKFLDSTNQICAAMDSSDEKSARILQKQSGDHAIEYATRRRVYILTARGTGK